MNLSSIVSSHDSRLLIHLSQTGKYSSYKITDHYSNGQEVYYQTIIIVSTRHVIAQPTLYMHQIVQL